MAALADLADEAGHVDDLDGMEVFEVEQMRITGDDEVSLALQCAGQELVIRRVRGQAIRDVPVLGDDRLAKHQAKEAPMVSSSG